MLQLLWLTNEKYQLPPKILVFHSLCPLDFNVRSSRHPVYQTLGAVDVLSSNCFFFFNNVRQGVHASVRTQIYVRICTNVGWPRGPFFFVPPSLFLFHVLSLSSARLLSLSFACHTALLVAPPFRLLSLPLTLPRRSSTGIMTSGITARVELMERYRAMK